MLVSQRGGPHEVFEQYRHQREGQPQAGHKRNDHRQRERRKQIFCRPLEEKNRHEDDADAQRRQGRGNADLAGPFDD